MRIQPRNRVGKYKHSSWHNFKKRKRGWREYAIHPITVSVFGLLSYVGVHTAWAFDEAGKLESKFTIYNFSQEFSTREDSKGDGLSPSTNPEESTGETVKAVSDNPKSEEGQTPSQVQSPSSIEEKILKAWEGTGEGHIAVAVAKSESGKNFNTHAIGWNCHYTNAQGKRYSAACRPEDRARAWSVDCGVMQINHLGKTCPENLFDPDENIKAGKQKYDNSLRAKGDGFLPWVAYWKGLYQKHL